MKKSIFLFSIISLFISFSCQQDNESDPTTPDTNGNKRSFQFFYKGAAYSVDYIAPNDSTYLFDETSIDYPMLKEITSNPNLAVLSIGIDKVEYFDNSKEMEEAIDSNLPTDIRTKASSERVKVYFYRSKDYGSWTLEYQHTGSDIEVSYVGSKMNDRISSIRCFDWFGWPTWISSEGLYIYIYDDKDYGGGSYAHFHSCVTDKDPSLKNLHNIPRIINGKTSGHWGDRMSSLKIKRGVNNKYPN